MNVIFGIYKSYIYFNIDIIRSLFSLFQMCVIADMHLVEWKTNQTLTIPKIYGVNISQTPYKGKSDLSPNLIVLSWYKNQIHYNYEEGPQSTDTSKFKYDM